MPKRKRILILAALLVGVIAFSIALTVRNRQEDDFGATDVQPPGRWTFQADRLATEVSEEELARVLSLPYVSGSMAAPELDGVRIHRQDKAFAGLNLYVSGHGPEAYLVDMDGSLVHRWRYPFARAFPEKTPSSETAFFRRAHLYPTGELLVIFQGGGMLKLDADSHLLWTSDLPLYNHLFVDGGGTIFSIAKHGADPARSALRASA